MSIKYCMLNIHQDIFYYITFIDNSIVCKEFNTIFTSVQT